MYELAKSQLCLKSYQYFSDVNEMTKQTVKTVVPKTLNKLRAISGFHQGRSQISDILHVAGQNISIENSTLTPEERAFLTYRMQLKLGYQMDAKRQTVSILTYFRLNQFTHTIYWSIFNF